MNTPLNTQQFGGEQRVPLVPVIGAKSFNQLKGAERLQIELIVDAKDIGTWYRVPEKDYIKVWDGEDWLEIPYATAIELGVMPHNMTERFNAEEIEWMVEVVQEREEENERLLLRHLLEEQQSGRE